MVGEGRRKEENGMGKEEGKEDIAVGTSKRMTRSSFATSPIKFPPTRQRQNSSRLDPQPISSTNSSSSPAVCLDELYSSLPGRRFQVLEILRLIGPLDSPMLPLLLYGGTSTGKTRSILQIFRHLHRPFVYVSCRSCYNPRILFENVLNQLARYRRNSGNGYSSWKRCERASEFVDLFGDALLNIYGNQHEKKLGVVSEPIKEEGMNNGKMIYFIFDNIELIPHWGKNSSSLLSLLFKLPDVVRMPAMFSLICISSSTPEIYYTHSGSMEPLLIFFPDYTEEELHQILIRNQDNPKLYSSFLKMVLKLFVRVTRRVDELSIVLKPLFLKYCEPLTDLSNVPDEATKRRLFESLQPHISSSLDEIFKVTPRLPNHVMLNKCNSGKRNSRSLSGREGSNVLDFHMSVSAKYLLISAFLASRNPATLDASMFDTTGSSNKQKRRRRSSETSIQLKENKAQELLMKGPGSFSLERLLAIFQCITSVADISLDEEDAHGGDLTQQDGEIGLMSDVLLQLSTLCNANFIGKGGSCPLESSTRYRSNIDEDMALKVARSINFPLSKYMYRS